MAEHAAAPQLQEIVDVLPPGITRTATGAADEVPVSGNALLIEAAMSGQLDRLSYLLDEGVSPGAWVEHGTTALHAACMEGHAACVELLIQHKAKLDATDQDDVTPLYAASCGKHPLCVRLLLEAAARGGEVAAAAARARDQPAKNGATALYAGVASGCLASVKLLVQAKANIDAPAVNGSTPAFVAAASGFDEILQELIRAGADLHRADINGFRPIHAAAGQGNVGALRLLISSGSMLAQCANNGMTPLDTAAAGGGEDAERNRQKQECASVLREALKSYPPEKFAEERALVEAWAEAKQARQEKAMRDHPFKSLEEMAQVAREHPELQSTLQMIAAHPGWSEDDKMAKVAIVSEMAHYGGRRVRIRGLSGRAELNGSYGRSVGYVRERQRHLVQLQAEDGTPLDESAKPLALKAANLEILPELAPTTGVAGIRTSAADEQLRAAMEGGDLEALRSAIATCGAASPALHAEAREVLRSVLRAKKRARGEAVSASASDSGSDSGSDDSGSDSESGSDEESSGGLAMAAQEKRQRTAAEAEAKKAAKKQAADKVAAQKAAAAQEAAAARAVATQKAVAEKAAAAKAAKAAAEAAKAEANGAKAKSVAQAKALIAAELVKAKAAEHGADEKWAACELMALCGALLLLNVATFLACCWAEDAAADQPPFPGWRFDAGSGVGSMMYMVPVNLALGTMVSKRVNRRAADVAVKAAELQVLETMETAMARKKLD